MRRFFAAATVIAISLTAFGAPAQEFPNRTVTMIVPFRAGGPTDTVGRTLSASMSRHLGEQVVVQIVDGAGGTLGAARVAQAEPDGYTILLYHIGMATTPALFPNLPFDPLTDFTEIGLATEVPMTLVGRQRLPVGDFAQLVDYIDRRRDVVTMAHAGLGSASHLCAMLFQQALGIDITTIPYNGTAPAMLDLRADFVDMMCDQTTSTTAGIQSGGLIPYFVTNPTRLDQIAEVPTSTEVGLEGMELRVWHGLWAPAGTPPEIIAELNAALQFALADPEVLRVFDRFATEPSPIEDQTPEALRARVESEIAYWGAVIEAAGNYAGE